MTKTGVAVVDNHPGHTTHQIGDLVELPDDLAKSLISGGYAKEWVENAEELNASVGSDNGTGAPGSNADNPVGGSGRGTGNLGRSKLGPGGGYFNPVGGG
jgi:hypothetical protein